MNHAQLVAALNPLSTRLDIIKALKAAWYEAEGRVSSLEDDLLRYEQDVCEIKADLEAARQQARALGLVLDALENKP